MQIGFKLSSEERSAPELVADARAAERAGFDFLAISDHYHPWTDRQGQSPFVWGVLGGIAEATDRIVVGTAVTCPTFRIHPAIVAQAAATAATMLPGRFFLGLGTGENLNEHILGDPWPRPAVRRELLEEAIDVIRALWEGELVDHEGPGFRVEGARLYSIPDEPPPILLAASGTASASLAGRVGDGLIGLSPEREMIDAFRRSGGEGAPAYAELTVRFDDDPDRALRDAAEQWPLPGIPGELTAELSLPRHFEQVATIVRPEDLEGKIAVGPDPAPYGEMASRFVDAGYDHVWFSHVGEDKERFLGFAREVLLPELRRRLAA